jgi:hypothetical protein
MLFTYKQKLYEQSLPGHAALKTSSVEPSPRLWEG